jgi:hypothetical protein
MAKMLQKIVEKLCQEEDPTYKYTVWKLKLEQSTGCLRRRSLLHEGTTAKR